MAAEEHVDVHGTLWLMEQLMNAGILTVDQAGEAYDRMKEARSRLPWDVVERQLIKQGRQSKGA